MRYLIMLFIILLIPTGSFAKGECKEERKKFCQGLEKAELMDCLKKHQAELSAQCKTASRPGSKPRKSDGRSALKDRQRWARTKAPTMSRVMALSLKTTRAKSNSPTAEIPLRAISLSRYASTRAAGRTIDGARECDSLTFRQSCVGVLLA